MVKGITAPDGVDPRLGMLTRRDDSSVPDSDWIPSHKGSRASVQKSHRGKQGLPRGGLPWLQHSLDTYGSESVAHLKMVPGAYS